MNILSQFYKLHIPAIVILTMALATPHAQADNGAGFKLAYGLFFGKQSEENDSKSCANMDSGGGGSVLQSVNAFFCQLEKRFGITQAPTSGGQISVTKTYSGRTVHIEIVGQAGGGAQSAAGFNDDGSANSTVGYDYLAKVWVCKASGTVLCTNVTDFTPALAIAYSYSADGTLSKGNMLQDPSAREGLGGGAALSIVYNTGSGATKKSISVKHLFKNGDKMRIDGASASGILDVQMVHDQSSAARRFTAKVNTLTSDAAAGFAQGIALSDNTTAADAAQCFKRTDDGAGDWAYNLNATGTCSVSAYSDSVSTVNSYSFNGIMKINPSDTNWSNGMAPTPVTL